MNEQSNQPTSYGETVGFSRSNETVSAERYYTNNAVLRGLAESAVLLADTSKPAESHNEIRPGTTEYVIGTLTTIGINLAAMRASKTEGVDMPFVSTKQEQKDLDLAE